MHTAVALSEDPLLLGVRLDDVHPMNICTLFTLIFQFLFLYILEAGNHALHMS